MTTVYYVYAGHDPEGARKKVIRGLVEAWGEATWPHGGGAQEERELTAASLIDATSIEGDFVVVRPTDRTRFLSRSKGLLLYRFDATEKEE